MDTSSLISRTSPDADENTQPEPVATQDTQPTAQVLSLQTTREPSTQAVTPQRSQSDVSMDEDPIEELKKIVLPASGDFTDPEWKSKWDVEPSEIRSAFALLLLYYPPEACATGSWPATDLVEISVGTPCREGHWPASAVVEYAELQPAVVPAALHNIYAKHLLFFLQELRPYVETLEIRQIGIVPNMEKAFVGTVTGPMCLNAVVRKRFNESSVTERTVGAVAQRLEALHVELRGLMHG
ncbi:hypothetical protein BJ508DRAFT_310403 [Ascobolus immersus RN42]|uniref:Uncharacterized protein n=1 Tax=Ascobolus immersus RN42 TaxID=1160509 RepID=A0A3N4HTH3_ASCIM|nr:hypothetical protein BJ508DRAFT_310403 [Ascobolus immersus RN42]